jgi:hypothetical protein
MPYTFSSKTIEDDNIVQSREFDVALDAYVDTLNGGIDRENLPVSSVQLNDRGQSAVYNSGRHWIFGNNVPDKAFLDGDDIFAIFANNPRNNFIIGFRYDSDKVNGGGGVSYWKSMQLADVEEGMMTITYTQSSFVPKYWTFYLASGAAQTVARKNFRTYIRYNGVVVYVSDYEYQMWMTRTHTVTFPVPAGDGLIELGVELRPQKDDADTQVILSFVGGQVHAFNRRR